MRCLGLIPMLVVASLATTSDYCSVCTDHTMCLYGKTDIGSACTDYSTATVNQSAINLIVHRHNLLRNRVAQGVETNGVASQPSASNMRKMIWNTQLANISQRWANQCTFEHDSCRNLVDGTYSGQNLYWEASTGNLASPNWTKAIQAWYDEVNDRNGTLNILPFTQTSGAVVGHYTQLVWANTYKVGCGYADYSTVRSNRTWNARLVVCNYSPGGNILSQNMYESGTAASNCPTGTTQDSYFTGLCS